MFAFVIVSVIILVLAIFVYLEYRNEKAYQEERKKRSEERKRTKAPYDPKSKIQKPLQQKKEKAKKLKASTPGAKDQYKKEKPKPADDTYELLSDDVEVTDKKEETYVVKPRKVPSAQELREAEEQKVLEEQRLEEQRLEEERVKAQKAEEESKPEPAAVTKEVDLPECKYPKFNYSRLLEMGLGEEEAIEFTKELIPQIKTHIPLIKEAMEKEDFDELERLTHSVKGSSTTVGTGGVSDLLSDFNTYIKTGKDIPVVEAYLNHLIHYSDELEKQFS